MKNQRIVSVNRSILWPKPLTEMTVVKLSYQLRLTKHTILYKWLNVRSKSDHTACQINFKVNVVSLLPGMRHLWRHLGVRLSSGENVRTYRISIVRTMSQCNLYHSKLTWKWQTHQQPESLHPWGSYCTGPSVSLPAASSSLHWLITGCEPTRNFRTGGPRHILRSPRKLLELHRLRPRLIQRPRIGSIYGLYGQLGVRLLDDLVCRLDGCQLHHTLGNWLSEFIGGLSDNFR